MRSHTKFHYKSINCPFALIYQSQETGLHRVTCEVILKVYRPFCSPQLTGCLSSMWCWCPVVSRQHPSVLPPCLSSFSFSASFAPHLALKYPSCRGFCPRPASMFMVSVPKNWLVTPRSSLQLFIFSELQTCMYSCLLSIFRCPKLNSPFSSKALWPLWLYCQAKMGRVYRVLRSMCYLGSTSSYAT